MKAEKKKKEAVIELLEDTINHSERVVSSNDHTTSASSHDCKNIKTPTTSKATKTKTPSSPVSVLEEGNHSGSEEEESDDESANLYTPDDDENDSANNARSRSQSNHQIIKRKKRKQGDAWREVYVTFKHSNWGYNEHVIDFPNGLLS